MKNTIPAAEQFITLEDFLVWANRYFEQSDIYYGHGTDNPWDEAVMLALYVLQLPAENDSKVLQTILKPNQQQQLLNLALRRVQENIPIPYLTNEAWFAGERYYVTKDVLIPRSPLAELICNHFQPWLGKNNPQHILDLCTGSGCLAILCAKKFPNSKVDAIDISKAALEVAEKNIVMHACQKQVHAIESDLFSAVEGTRYDIIISNPPYVSDAEMRELPKEYTHEPTLALASGNDGLDLTRKILQQAANYLTDDGLLIVEVGNSWQTLAEKYPDIEFIWLEFANGGDGVFLLTAAYLRELKLWTRN